MNGINPDICLRDMTNVVPGAPMDVISVLRGGRLTLGGDISEDDLSPIEVTERFLRRRLPGYRTPTLPERPQYMEAYATKVVVSGRRDSIEDLALYWALRQRLPRDAMFPLWLPLEFLEEPAVRAALDDAERTERRVSLMAPEGLQVLSCSAPAEEITATLQRAGITAAVETERLYRYYAPEMQVDTEEETEIHFHERVGRFRVPAFEPADHLLGRESFALDVDLPSLRLPPLASLSRRLYGTVERSSRNGIVLRSKPENRRDLLFLHSPTWWEVLTTVVGEAGFTIEPSDKGRLALAVLDMLGGIENIDVLASSRIFAMLEHMAKPVMSADRLSRLRERLATLGPDDADDFLDRLRLSESRRPDLPLGEIKRFLPSRRREPVIRWLLERRIIERGAEVRCPHCRLPKWYEIGRLQPDRFRCDGCFREMAVPFMLNRMEWRYRLNDLFARAYDQGIFPVLLTVLWSWDPLASSTDAQTVGFFPGAVLTREGGGGAPSKVDVDFIKLFDGRLILGECKVDANDIGEDQLRGYGELGQRLGCSRLLVSSRKVLTQENRARILDILVPYVPLVQFVVSDDLTDRTLSQRMSDKPGDPGGYLDYLLTYRLHSAAR